MGRTIPVPVCTAAEPCPNPIALLPRTPISEPSFVPVCATGRAGHPSFDDGAPLAFTTSDGITRYACRYRHPDATSTAQRPLIVWIPGSGGSAQNIYDTTLLRQKAIASDLVGAASRAGYHLLSVQPRNLRWPTSTAQDGPKHDFLYRDLASPSRNVDLANLDRLIDDALLEGTVDPARIFVMGWSNGAQFAQLYAIARHATATPGGHRVAAAAVYSGADPFHNQADRPTPSCQLDPYPTTTVPIMVVSRACDVYACDAAQAADLSAEGQDINPGAIVTDWMADIAGKMSDPNGQWLLLSGIGTVATQCTGATSCSVQVALGNHIRWPDGLAMGDGGRDHEPSMLDFFRTHPHPNP